MKYWLQKVMQLFGARSPSADERYLARSVDANDFEIRLQALERMRG